MKLHKILIIGGAGYIGSHVVLALCDQGYDLTVFDNLSTGHKENIDTRAIFIQGDILIDEDLENLFSTSSFISLHIILCIRMVINIFNIILFFRN